MSIKNRIIGSGEESLDQIQFNPRNWRVHPLNQQNALDGVLETVGWAQQVVVNKRTGNLVDGHLRCQLAARKGEKTIPVVYVDLSEEEEALVLATIDPIAAMATTDKQKLDELFAGIESDNENVKKMLDDIAEKERLEYANKPIEDAEAQIDRAEELRVKWGVELGQLWQLGDHRLICGDCTDKAVVDRVMGGEKAELAPVDPPYNVGFDYDGETVDDKKNYENYEQFSRAWFSTCQSVSDKQIVTPGCNNLAYWLRWFDPLHWAPWTKSNSMTNGRVSRFWCWEPVLFFGNKWQRRRSNDLFDYPIGKQEGVANHPCPKPLKMWVDLIENYSEEGAIIFESFSGSGTTIIACENLHRKCRAVEISPAYVAVALQRWADLTGKTPELIG